MIFWSVIRRVVRDGRLAIVSSHYTEDLPLVADYVVVLSRGKKIAEGNPSNVIRDVLGPCSYKVIIRSRYSTNGTSIESSIDALRESSNGVCRFVRLGEDTVIVYASSPQRVVSVAEYYGLDVEVAPVGLGDIVLALGERE